MPTPAARLQPWIVDEHRRAVGMPPLTSAQARQLFDAPSENLLADKEGDKLTDGGNETVLDVLADPECLAWAKAEVTRLRAPGAGFGPRRTLAEHDHDSKIRCQALERLIAQYEGNEDAG